MKTPELIAPGGSYTKAMIAGEFGADAVYLGVPFTSLRMRQNKVKSFIQVKEIINDLHKINKKAYLTMNIFPRNDDIKLFESVVEQISDLGADAIIFSDLGTYKIIKKYLPNINLHLSTQTNTLNYLCVEFWLDLGINRIVLSRELSLKEIAEIKEKIPKMELEIFAHGAMCMSYSGRCLLGEYFSGRDANKGECSHVCRYKYKVFIEEEKRPGKFYQIDEKDEYTHILSSKDLNIINKLKEVIPYVDGLKIEGRSKGEFYVGSTVKAYKNALDSISKGLNIPYESIELLDSIPHRPYWDGFLFNNKDTNYPEKESINYEYAGPISGKKYYGLIHKKSIILNNSIYYKVTPKDNIKVGDEFEALTSNKKLIIKILEIVDENFAIIDQLTCNSKQSYIKINTNIDGRGILFL